MHVNCYCYYYRYALTALLRDLYLERNSGRLDTFLRMTPEDFEFLLARIGPQIQKKDTHLRKAITPKERFVITMRFLASGDSYEDLSFLARVSPQSISTIVMEVCHALVGFLANLVQVRFLM